MSAEGDEDAGPEVKRPRLEHDSSTDNAQATAIETAAVDEAAAVDQGKTDNGSRPPSQTENVDANTSVKDQTHENDKNEWIEYFDTLAFKSYYYNPQTKLTRWDLPDDACIIGKDGARPPEPEEQLTETPQPAPLPLTKEEQDALIEEKKAEEIERNAAIARQMAKTVNSPDFVTSAAALDRCLPLPPALASLPPKLKVFMRHDRPPTAAELGRPARVQANAETLQSTSYIQGQEEFNIWYGKYASDRFGESGRRERIPALTHCNVFKDAGFTRADVSPHLAGNPICLYFAKGCCTSGHNCQYYHHVPTREESDKLDLMHDIFGRERHAQQRDDMEGVGSFNSTSRTLFVGDYKVDRIDANFDDRIEQLILAHFSVYGPIEDIRVIPNRNFAFVTFCYRAAAEFAKVAMANYRLENNDEVLTVKWAQANRNPANQARIAAREYEDAKRIVMERMRQMALDEAEVTSFTLTPKLMVL